MAPIILHRALSFSNLPLHRRDVSPLQDASAVPNRPEGLALLTTIAEGTDFCNPSPPLPNHSSLEKRLIIKILHLREILDLPQQSSCNALDQLLLDTLGVLKIAYPKCLSGLSGNYTSSVREGLVHLHKVLMLVQDCHSKNKQLPSSGSEKQTIIGSESLDDVGERVIEMLDQVKEILSLMESSSSAKAVSSSAWPEDLPERSSLPPVLCRAKSPVHRASASHNPSDGDEAARPRQDGPTTRHTEHCKAPTPAPGQEADEGGCTCTREEEDGYGQTSSRREPPSTPSPPADSSQLQSTSTPSSSVSPHLLSAPPPSPMPVVGLPMLLQSWEGMQDGHAAAAVVPSTGVAQPAAEAAPTAQEDTSMEGSTSSASLEASQPSMDSPSASPNGRTPQPLVQDNNAAVPNVPPLPAYRDRFQEGPSSTDEPGQAVTLTDAPPPPPSEAQGGPPAPPATKVSPAPPPPPAPGSISAVVRGKKAASKLKRSTQMGSLYRRLRDGVEGSGSTHGGDRRRQNGKRARTAGAPKSDAGGGQGMADALAEMTKRSAYFRQIEEDAEKHAAAILELKDAIGSFQSKDMAELVSFHQHVEQQLVCLTDETQVLARFEGFPSKKLEALRTAAGLYSKLDGAASRLKCWKLTAGPVSPQLDKVDSYFNKVKDDVDMVERNRDEETKRLQSHGVHLDLGVLVRIKEGMVDLSSACMELALKESQQDATETTTTTRAQWASSHGDGGASRMLWRVFQLAFRVYSFAGGQDERADRLTSVLAHEIEARRLCKP